MYFLKPDTSLLKKGAPFFIPNHSNNVHHELELVVKINRLGKHIEERFAHKYYNEISLGLDFTARDVQQECKEKGLPWEKAKAFDGSSPIGKFIDASPLKKGPLKFELLKNGEVQQSGDTQDMIFNVDHPASSTDLAILVLTSFLLETLPTKIAAFSLTNFVLYL